MIDIVILGAGGHARVLLDTFRLLDMLPLGVISPAAPGPEWPKDVRYLGDDAKLAGLDTRKVFLANGVGSIKDTEPRRELYTRGKRMGFDFASALHPSAVIAADALLGEGVQIMAGAVIQAGTKVADNVIVNTGAIVDHDCTIGPHSHISPGATFSGAVRAGAGVHIGTGAAIMQGIQLGDRAIIGAGAVVIADVPAGSMVVGNPAKAVGGISR